ncbi:hypothetical protein F3J44_18245 [Pantoea sp. Tr-811]|nr:hypothetical protein [Pantoea sp. Tr-811]
MGSARLVIACIRAPSFSIPNPVLEEDEQIEFGVISFVWRLIQRRESSNLTKERKCIISAF